MTPQTSKHGVALFALALGAIGPASTGASAQESPPQLEAPAAVYETVLDALGETHDVLVVDEATRPCSMHLDALSTIRGARGEALRDCAAKEALEPGLAVESLSPNDTDSCPGSP